MNTILLSSSSGGEAAFIGLMTGIFCIVLFWLFGKAKTVTSKVATNMTLQMNPNDINSLIKKGYSEISKKNYFAAIDYFQRAINLSPNNCDALSGIAFAYHINKDYINSKSAIEAYQNNSDIDTIDNSMAALMMYLYGHHCFMEGNFEQAKTCKENAKLIATVSQAAMEIINDLNLY